MRYLWYLFLLVTGVALLVVALANRDIVTLRLLPEEMGNFLGISWTVDLPLFLVIFGGIAAGLMIGFLWEWLREHKHRAAAATAQRQARRLEREVTRLRVEETEPQDDVLALLDKPRKVG